MIGTIVTAGNPFMNHLTIMLTAAVGFFIASEAAAQVELLQPDFTFRNVTVPTAGSRSRITVQIDPDVIEPGTDDAADDASGAAAPVASALGWFWDGVSPRLADSGPGRLQVAIERINTPPAGQSVPAPRLQGLQDIAALHGISILRETVGTDVSPALVLAVIAVESAGRTDAVSTAGAQGLMQLMPATAERFGVTNSLDPAQNIKGGVAYLEWLLGRFDNDPVLVLAGYNAGEGNVSRYEGVPPFAETRDYVPKVLAAWQVAKGLCLSPPELITDGCVFAVNGS